MSQIFNRIQDVDPNDSEAVKDAVGSFFQNLPNHIGTDCNRWLRAIESIVTRFPKYCSQHRNTIEKYLVRFLDSTNYYNVVDAAKCAHAIQQIRPSQDKGATPKNCWREQMGLLCNTAHTLIEAVFSKTVNIYKNARKTQKEEAQLLANTALNAAFTEILNISDYNTQDSSVTDKKTILTTRLRNIFVFIQAMLVETYPIPKPIQPQLILEVVLQAVSVSSSVSSDISEASIVKTQALRTIDAMVACLGPNLIPFSALVFRLAMQTLRWSTDNSNEESRKVRCSAYASLEKWLTTLHTHRTTGDSRGRSWEDELTHHIIQDITPPKKIVQLTMSSIPTKNLSKKAKRKLANSMLHQSTIANHMPGEKNKINVSEEASDDVVNAALQCAETFMTVSGIFLKPTTHKMFQERLVRECYNLDNYSVERGIRLVRALEACRKNSAPTVPPPTQHCLELHTTLINSRSDEIKKFCSQAILDIRLHLHCSPPSLSFALDEHPDKKKSDEKRKRISEKNRAALESLLGKERMPAETVDEVITIPDEPSNKKQRLEEDITDKISVSSESVNSIEISDDSDEDIAIEEEVRESESATETIEAGTEETSVTYSRTNAINEEITQKPIEIRDDTNENNDLEPTNDQIIVTETVQSEAVNIFDAKTQVPLNESHDTEEGDKSPVSMEVAYDLPNTASKVTVLEKLDDENLPSTNDTDDIQITCGQVAKSSQDLEAEKNKVTEEVPKVNGITVEVKVTEEIVENGVVHEETQTAEVKSSKEVTVDDMLADFVDEVIEENVTPA